MASGKRSFLLYTDVHHTVKKLTDLQAGQLFKHLLSYVNDENPVTDDIIIEIAFEPIKQSLKRDLRKYEIIREKRSQAGKASADKRQQVLTSVEQIKPDQHVLTNSTVNDSVSVSVSDNVSDSVKVKERRKKKSFIPPSLEDVKIYFKDNGYDPAIGIKAWMSYDAANWFDSQGKPVLNWKQKMINVWFRDENKINGKANSGIQSITVATSGTKFK